MEKDEKNPYSWDKKEFPCPLQSEHRDSMTQEEFNEYYAEKCTVCPGNSFDRLHNEDDFSMVNIITKEIFTILGPSKILELSLKAMGDKKKLKEIILAEFEKEKKENDSIEEAIKFLTSADLVEFLDKAKDSDEYRSMLIEKAKTRTKMPELNLGYLEPKDLRVINDMKLSAQDKVDYIDTLITTRKAQAFAKNVQEDQ